MSNVPIADWGKDHFSLLGYVECRCVDYGGVLDYRHARVNPSNHPFGKIAGLDPNEWDPRWGTRLRGFFLDGGKTDPARRLTEHDDIDCLEDLEAAGLVEIVSLVNGFVRLTPKGSKLAVRLREHKANGGHFATFVYAEEGAAAGRHRQGGRRRRMTLKEAIELIKASDGYAHNEEDSEHAEAAVFVADSCLSLQGHRDRLLAAVLPLLAERWIPAPVGGGCMTVVVASRTLAALRDATAQTEGGAA